MEGLARLEMECCSNRRGRCMGGEISRKSRNADDVTGEHGWFYGLVQERKYEVTEVAVRENDERGPLCSERMTYSSLVFWVKIMNKEGVVSWAVVDRKRSRMKMRENFCSAF